MEVEEETDNNRNKKNIDEFLRKLRWSTKKWLLELNTTAKNYPSNNNPVVLLKEKNNKYSNANQ